MQLRRFILWPLILALLLAPAAASAQAVLPFSAPLAKSDQVRAGALQLAPAKATLYVGSDGAGGGVALVALVKPEGTGGQLSWKSSKASVATVDENGYVTPHKAGTAVITCQTTDGSRLKRTCRVTVKPQPPQSLSLEGESIDMTPGTARSLAFSILPANAVNQKVTWKSSKTSVVKVNTAGLMTAVKPGSAVITCKTRSGGLTARMTVNVGYGDTDIYYLAVGQAEYTGASKLPSAYDDVRRFSATLESCDWGQQSMNGSQHYNLTADQLRLVLAQLPQAGMGENDVTYVYYSGHGLSSANRALRGALVGVDYSAGGGYVTVDEVRGYLDKVPGTVVVVLDCCLAGQYIAAKGAGGSVSQAQVDQTLNGMVDVFKGGSAATAKGINSLVSGNAGKSKYKIIAACKSLELSYTGDNALNQYSVFTRYICEGAGVTGAERGSITVGTGLPADRNKDGFVSLAELKKYAAPKITKMVKSLVKEKQTMAVWPAGDTFPVFGRLN